MFPEQRAQVSGVTRLSQKSPGTGECCSGKLFVCYMMLGKDQVFCVRKLFEISGVLGLMRCP